MLLVLRFRIFGWENLNKFLSGKISFFLISSLWNEEKKHWKSNICCLEIEQVIQVEPHFKKWTKILWRDRGLREFFGLFFNGRKTSGIHRTTLNPRDCHYAKKLHAKLCISPHCSVSRNFFYFKQNKFETFFGFCWKKCSIMAADPLGIAVANDLKY